MEPFYCLIHRNSDVPDLWVLDAQTEAEALREPHLALAKDCLTDEHADALMSVIGRHAWTARILMAED